jgi:hypothetical protein
VEKPDIKALIVKGVDRALTIQQPVVRAHVQRLRRTRPYAAPTQIVTALEKHYLGTVTTLGGAVGAAAIVPGPGTVAATLLAAAEIPSFLEATVLYALAVAEVHGIEIQDLERRRTLVLAVLVGDSASSIVAKIAGRTGKHWGKQLVKGIPIPAIRAINKVLGHNFVTKQGTKQGILVLGRDVPFGIGAGIGAAGNWLIGKSSVRAARKAFGPAPKQWA